MIPISRSRILAFRRFFARSGQALHAAAHAADPYS